MGGIKALRKLQLGKETTGGTAVAATTIWRGDAVLTDAQKLIFPKELVGYVDGVDRSYIPHKLAGIKMNAIEATFEQLPYIFNAGIEGVAGVQDGAGTGYLYTYNAPTTALNTLYTYTIEGGDNQQAREVEYAFVTDFTIQGAVKEALKVSANWAGRQSSLTSFTGSLSIPSVDEILFGKGKLYIDAVGGTIGTTQKTATWLGFKLNVKTGWRPLFTGDGNIYFTQPAFSGETLAIDCDLTFEHDAIGVAQIAAMEAETTQLFRLLFQGPALGTAGTAYTYKTFTVDFAGKYQDAPELADKDGDDVITLKSVAKYNATAQKYCDFLVVNELSALP